MFSIGMYVKFRASNSEGEVRTILGQIEKAMTSQAIVLCFERSGGIMSMKRTRIDLTELSRARIRIGSICSINGKQIIIAKYSRKKTTYGLRAYYCYYEKDNEKKVFLVSEDKIVASYQDADVTAYNEFVWNEMSIPSQYICREQVRWYLNSISLIPEGFNTVVGSKIDLYEHQLQTVHTILSQKPYRAMLADEVGLGKSIEALVVLSYALKTKQCKTALLVVPDQLEYQWSQESYNKFGLDVQAFRLNDFIYKKTKSNLIVVGFSDFKRYQMDYIGNKSWDFVIIDEAHRTLHDRTLYNGVLKLSRNASCFLMLSATPILQRQQEYYNLLKLLYPNAYSKVSYNAFENIMKQRELIKDQVLYLANNIDHYYEYSLEEEFIGMLGEIDTLLEDSFLHKLVEATHESGSKYELIRVSIQYLQNTYELDQKFIRHRRSSILDPSSKRVLDNSFPVPVNNYTNGLLERDFFNYTLEELEKNIESKSISIDDAIDIGRSIFSSIRATLQTILSKDLETLFPDTFKFISAMSQVERRLCSNSKLDKLVELIKNDYFGSQDKIIIFSDYSSTVDLIEERLIKEFSSKAVVKFTNALTPAQMQIAANRFQHEKQSRFLVCDKSGGEGRNFQYAEFIIHYDTPWSPAEVEQRIGRLDRIGRRAHHTVKNVVLYIPDTIEEDMFRLLNECLNVYEESLCGIEIVFDDMNEMIRDHIQSGIKLGLEGLNDPLRELKQLTEDQISNEAIALMIKQSEDGYRNLEEEVISSFDEDKLANFQDAIVSWVCMENLAEVVEQTDPYRLVSFKINPNERATKYGNQAGTFFVKDALAYEDIPLLSNDNAFISFVSNEIDEDLRSKVSAVELNNCGFEWAGYIFCWQLALYLDDYFGGAVPSDIETLKNDFILKSRVAITAPIGEYQELDADTILNIVLEQVRDGSARKIDKDEIVELCDYADIDSDLKMAINESAKNYSEIQKSLLAHSALDEAINKQKFECMLNEQLGKPNDIQSDKLKFYQALKTAMGKFSGELDSILFVRVKG